MTRQIPRHRRIVGFIIAGLRIYDVESESDWKRFLELPVAVYRGDARYTAIDAGKERASVCRPKFDGRQRVLIGLDGDRCVARVVTRLSPTLNDESGLPVGMLGFFEALDEPDAVSALLDEAASWLRSSGAGEIVGPMDGDTWHRYRFNIGPFERPLFMLEPYNKPGYGAAWEQCGFEPLESYFSTVVDDVTPAHQALAPRLATIGEHGYELRQFDPERFHDELRTLHALSCDIFAENLLYDPISEEDFIAIYDGVRPILDPSLVWFAHHQGKPAGFVFSYLGGDAVNIKSLGVTADHRRAGLGGALAGRVYQSMVDKGIRKVNLCLIRDGNPSGRLEGGVGKVFRRYVLYRYGSVSRGPMKEP